MRDPLARLLFPFGSTRRVLRGPARGLRFVVEPGMGATYALGTEAAAPRDFARWVRPGATVYDLGANKGQMALLFAALVGPSGRVVSLEPAPAEAASLRRNVALNGLATVRVVEAAAAEAAGSLTFAYDPAHPTQGKLVGVEQTYALPEAGTLAVPTLPLDALLDEEPPPDVLKVDVEGAAAAVLRGAVRVLEEVRPRLFIELHGPEEQAGLRDEVLARGYVAETLDGRRVADPTAGWHSPLWCHPAEGDAQPTA